MSLEKRVEQLEHRIGRDDDFLLIVVTFLAPGEKQEQGEGRELSGYRAVGRDRQWIRQPGQSLEDLKASMERELKAEGHKVYAVSECYAGEGDLECRDVSRCAATCTSEEAAPLKRVIVQQQAQSD